MAQKLNLGCGGDKRSGYVNVDIDENVEPDLVADIGDLPYDDNSVDEIILQDVLEHTADPLKWLNECYRVLKSGGDIYVRVPDFEKIIDPDFINSTPFYRTENRLLGGRDDKYDQHKCLFTKQILKKRLETAGFVDILIRRGDVPPLHWHLLCHAVKGGCQI